MNHMMRQTAPIIVQKRTLIGKRSMYYANPSDSEDLTKMRAPILPPVKLCGFGANSFFGVAGLVQ